MNAGRHGLWYFAHPYSCLRGGYQIQEGLSANFMLANQRASELILRGYNIFSPISHSHPIQKASPEMSKFSGEEEGRMWYALDNQFIERTNFDGIILAPKWDTSTGCRAERELFLSLGRQVLLYEDIIKR